MPKLVDDDFAADVALGAAKARQKVAARRGVTQRTGGPYPGYPFTPTTEHTEYILVIHHQRCRSCGAEILTPNKHLLARYAECASRILSFVTRDRVNPNLPRRVMHHIDDQGPDWCSQCYQPTAEEIPHTELAGGSGTDCSPQGATYPEDTR